MSELKDLPFESGDMKPAVFPGDNPVIRSYVGGLSLEADDVGVVVDDILADLSRGILEANPEARFNTLLSPTRPEGLPQARPEGLPQARPIPPAITTEVVLPVGKAVPAITPEVKREVVLPTGRITSVIIPRPKPVAVPSAVPSLPPVLPQPLPPVLPQPLPPVLPQPLPPAPQAVAVPVLPQPALPRPVLPQPALPRPVAVPGPVLTRPVSSGASLPVTVTGTLTPKIVSRVTSITRLPPLTLPSTASAPQPTLPPITLPTTLPPTTLPTTLPPTTLPPTTLPPTTLPPTTLQGNRPILPAVTGRPSSVGRVIPTKRIEIQAVSNVIKLPTAGGRPNLPITVVKEEESPMTTTSKGTEIMALDIEPIITPQNISSKRFELPTFSTALPQKKAVIVKRSVQTMQTLPTAAMASMTISKPTTSAEQRANELGIDLAQVNMERKGSYTVPRLREIIKALGLKGYSTAHKDELVRAIREHFGL